MQMTLQCGFACDTTARNALLRANRSWTLGAHLATVCAMTVIGATFFFQSNCGDRRYRLGNAQTHRH